MKQNDVENWDTIADLQNVIDSLVQTSKNSKENKKVRDLARHVAVYLICLKVDLKNNDII